MRIEDDVKLDFNDVLIKPKRSTLSSRSQVDLTREFKFVNTPGFTWKGVPIIGSNMSTVGVPQMAVALGKHNMMTCLHKHIDYKDKQYMVENGAKNVILSVGMKVEPDHYDLEGHIIYLDNHGVPVNFICIDVANGYSQKFVDTITRIKEVFPDKVIMAGNVVSPEMVEALILAGADVVKVGIGPGSACTTRVKTGVGYPQLSAIAECADAAHGLNGHIIGDGGCQTPGDVCKAFAAGADFVMLGGMLAGHDECGGTIVIKNENNNNKTEEVFDVDYYKKHYPNELFVEFYGMSSKKANEKFAGGMQDYRASEGRELLIPYKGSVDNIVQEILGGLRSCCTYTGSKTLKELPKRTTFVKVNRQVNESLKQFEVK